MKTTVEYGKIITIIRKAHHLNQKELSEKTAIGYTALNNYERNYTDTPLHVLEKVAAAFGISLVQMLIEYGSDLFPDLSQHKLQNADTVAVPYLQSKDITKELDQLPALVKNYITLSGDMIKSAGKYVCVKVKDDSMQDDGIRKNNFAIVRLTTSPVDKSIVLFVSRASGEYYIRRYFRDGHIVSMMPSSQSGEYSPVRYDERDTDYEIVGYVEKFLTSPM